MVPEDRYLTWLFGTWEWLLYVFGGSAVFRSTAQLVTPSYEHFPVESALVGQALVDDYMLFAREHAGISAWSIPDSVSLGHNMDDPISIVASLSRRIASEVVVAISSDAPSDDKAFEYTVDVVATFLGFGLFLCNRSSEVGRSQPWLPERACLTHLSELELSYALALFATLGEVPDRLVTPHLDLNPRAFFLNSQRHLLRTQGKALRRLRTVANASGPYRYIGVALTSD